jgi:hypothetical protein
MFRWLLMVVWAVPVFGQAVVESALGAGRAATTSAPAQKIGKSAAGIAESLSRALQAAPATPAATATLTVVSSAKAEAAPAPAAAKKYEDPALIRTGVSYEELLRRFGPPSMQVTTGAATKSLSYGGVQVEMEDGKVTAVDKPRS